MRFALVGAGGIGQVRARALAATQDCELVAIADVCKSRARALALSEDVSIHADHRQMLGDERVEAVVVSTPPQFHEEIVTAALEAGKHVLCEKPMANTLDACRRMVKVSRRTGNTLATGFNHRYFPAVQFVKQTLDSGLIGELDHVRAFAGHTGLDQFSAPWMYDPSVIGGGALMDNGMHIIDLVHYLLGDVVEVYGFATSNVWKLGRSEDNGCAILQGASGKYATLQATWTEWKGYRFYLEAYGNKGMARAYYAPMFSMAVFMDEVGGTRRRKFNFYPRTLLEEKLMGWQLTTEKAFRQEFMDFVRLCDGRSETIADGFSGFRAVEIANAVYRSSIERQPVKLAPPF